MSSSSGGDARVVLLGTTVKENTAGSGGGIYGFGGVLAVRSALIEENTAKNEGGGIAAFAMDIDMTQGSRVISNRAGGHGGGFYLNLSHLGIGGPSCTISGNVADYDGDGFGMGGGVYDSGSSLFGVSSAACNNEPDDIAP